MGGPSKLIVPNSSRNNHFNISRNLYIYIIDKILKKQFIRRINAYFDHQQLSHIFNEFDQTLYIYINININII